MKKRYFIFSKCNSVIKTTTFLLAMLGAGVLQNAKAQSTFEIEPNSQIKVAVDSVKSNFTAMASSNSLNVEGSFVIKEGYLDDISAFKLKMSLASHPLFSETSSKDSLGFNLSHVMILPRMRLIHIVGMLDVAGVSSRTELDFNFVVNEDQSISLFGTKSIKLSDYNKEAKFSSLALKNNNEIKLNMNLLFKNDQFNLASLKEEK